MSAPPCETSVVGQERVVPVVSPGPMVPVADFGPTDHIHGWVATGVVTLLATVTRF
ncbi:MAG: dolichyl-phosphate-mannose--protein mannosyltransferase, partial [Mycobacterium sp.]